MTSLSSLSPAQIVMLIRLDDGFQPEDSVGKELEDIRPMRMRTVDSLVKRGLVEMVPGRELQFWFRLTPEGFRVRDAWRGERIGGRTGN